MLSPIINTIIERKPTREPPALQVVSSYSSFVPNQVFDQCRPFEVLTYAVVQYLSFHSIKCSARNIAKNVNLSDKVIKNALYSLRKRQFIAKQGDSTYLFRKFNLEGSMEFVDAMDISRLLGYWFPIDILKSKRISNQAKKAFALILNLTKSGKTKIDMNYIGLKLDISREKASRHIGCLMAERLLSRHRNHCRSVFAYQIGEKAMSIYKNDLSTGHTDDCVYSNRITQKGHPDVTSKGHPDVTSFSIKESSKSLIDTRKDKSASDTYKSGQSKSISFFEEERKRLNVKYTKACNDNNWDRMREIGDELSTIDIMIKK